MEKIKSTLNDRFLTLHILLALAATVAVWWINIAVGLTGFGFFWTVLITALIGWNVYKEYRRRPVGGGTFRG